MKTIWVNIFNLFSEIIFLKILYFIAKNPEERIINGINKNFTGEKLKSVSNITEKQKLDKEMKANAEDNNNLRI